MAETNLVERIRGIFMSHLRHNNHCRLAGFPRELPVLAGPLQNWATDLNGA